MGYARSLIKKTPIIFTHEDVVNAIVSKDNRWLLSWNQSGSKLWSIEQKRLLAILEHDTIHNAKFTKNEKEIETSGGGLMKQWNFVEDKKLVSEEMIFESENSENGIKNKRDSFNYGFFVEGKKIYKHKLLVWGGDAPMVARNRRGALQLWSLETNSSIFSLKFDDYINGAILNEEENNVLFWTEHRIEERDMIENKRNFFLKGKRVNGVFYSKFKKEIVFWYSNGATLWSIANNQALLILEHKNISGVKFNQDETQILSWGGNYQGGSIKLWNNSSDRPLLELNFPKNILKATFSKDEKQIFFWTEKEKVRAYNLYPNVRLDKVQYLLKTQVETGAYLTPSGEVKALSKKEWEAKKKEYEKILQESKEQ